MTKLIALLSLATGVLVATPGEAAASDCTESYMLCIAGAGLLDEPFETLKDIECGAAYVGCVGSLLKFW